MSLSQAASSRSRSKGHGFDVRGERQGGGIGRHHTLQRTREWVSFLSLGPNYSFSSLSFIILLNGLYYFTQIEVSSADSDNKHKSYRLECHYNKKCHQACNVSTCLAHIERSTGLCERCNEVECLENLNAIDFMILEEKVILSSQTAVETVKQRRISRGWIMKIKLQQTMIRSSQTFFYNSTQPWICL